MPCGGCMLFQNAHLMIKESYKAFQSNDSNYAIFTEYVPVLLRRPSWLLQVSKKGHNFWLCFLFSASAHAVHLSTKQSARTFLISTAVSCKEGNFLMASSTVRDSQSAAYYKSKVSYSNSEGKNLYQEKNLIHGILCTISHSTPQTSHDVHCNGTNLTHICIFLE